LAIAPKLNCSDLFIVGKAKEFVQHIGPIKLFLEGNQQDLSRKISVLGDVPYRVDWKDILPWFPVAIITSMPPLTFQMYKKWGGIGGFPFCWAVGFPICLGLRLVKLTLAMWALPYLGLADEAMVMDFRNLQIKYDMIV
jgi:hypothetical protein